MAAAPSQTARLLMSTWLPVNLLLPPTGIRPHHLGTLLMDFRSEFMAYSWMHVFSGIPLRTTYMSYIA